MCEHCSGLPRYLFTDGLLLGVRGSPPSKVATLSRESMALLHHVRAELDRRKAFETASPDVRRRSLIHS